MTGPQSQQAGDPYDRGSRAEAQAGDPYDRGSRAEAQAGDPYDRGSRAEAEAAADQHHHHHPDDPNAGVLRGELGPHAWLAGGIAAALTIAGVVWLAVAIGGH
jgi:ABC-type Zn2+ transport system substrate-binding protein/surface adhesin